MRERETERQIERGITKIDKERARDSKRKRARENDKERERAHDSESKSK